MEGILFDIETLVSPVGILAGLALLAIAVASILLGDMADREAKGESIFWAESPFRDIGAVAPADGVKYPKAA